MGATLTTINALLKDFYLEGVQSQLNNEVLLAQLLDLDSENLEGLRAVVALNSSRSGGVGSRAEGGTLPTAGNQGFARATYDLAYHYGRGSVTGPAIAKTKSNAGAFLQVIKGELEGLKNDLAIDFARQAYGNGDAKVATCGVTSASTTVVLANSEAIDKGFLYVGMVIDIGTLANPVSVASARTVTDVNSAAATIVISGAAVTTAGTDFIFRSGNAAASSVNHEMNGLQQMLATAANTYGGINAASAGNAYWDNLRNNLAGAITLSALLSGWNAVRQNGAVGGNDYVAITTPGIVRRLFETGDFKSNVRFVNSEDMKGGFEMVSFNAGSGSIKLMADRHAPWGKVFIINKANVKLFSPGDWDFLDEDGQPVKWVADQDAFQFVLARYANLGASRRNNSIVIYGVTDTNGL